MNLRWLCLAAAPLLSACQERRHEPPECTTAKARAQELISAKRLDEATETLSAARSHCGRESEYDIDRLTRLLERERRHLTLRVEQQRERQSAIAQDPLLPFARWAASLREASDKAVGAHSCAPRTSADFGFCTSVVEHDGMRHSVRYWRDDARIFKFYTQVPAAARCDDLGAHRKVAEWTRGDATHTLCEPTEHGLKGTQVLISLGDGGSDVAIFSKSYPTKDESFRQALRR